ncbi:MAG: hypothetical protein B7Y50_04850 [Hydrogenophilales bacterium 28-61-11]|nr:MAG: hypothetical protein B7Y50_04850 [Hydrogenophilales bacterium 28-61-11]
MSSLSTIEKQRFEDLFGMSSGYVLNFSDQKFAEFFRQDVGINIYDPRYAYNGTSKAKRLRAFWEIEEPANLGRALERLLEVWRYLNEPGKDARADRQFEDCTRTAARLLGRELKQETESDFLKRDFGAISVEGLGLDHGVEKILAARVKEAVECVAAGAPLSAIFMCGSVLEGILMAVALKNPADFNRASASPKQKETGKVRPFHEWTLANLIDVSHEVGVPESKQRNGYASLSMSLNESIVEDADLEWFGELGYAVGHGPQLVPGEPAAVRESFGEVVLVGRLREAIWRPANAGSAIPADARPTIKRYLQVRIEGNQKP